MEIFSPEGPIYKFMRNLTDLLIINVLWILCSLPVITLGPATIAAFDVTMKMAGEEEGHVAAQFWQAFKKNLKTGIPYGLLLLAGSYLVWLNFSLFEQLEEHPFLLLVCGWVGGFLLVLMFLYAFALQARYRNTVMRTLKNSADIAIRCSDSIRTYFTDDEKYELANRINQTFVDTVRATGGNNAQRFLLIPGFGTNIDNTLDERFVMPTDSAENKLLISVHFYDPWALRMTSNPVIPGIRMSISTTSGCRTRIFSSVCSPLAASPHMVKPKAS